VVLATMVIMAVSSLNDKANRSKTQAQMKMLAEAITAFKSATGNFPLAVPEDAWGNWSTNGFPTIMKYDGLTGHPRWTNYFAPHNPPPAVPDYPVFRWETNNDPTKDPKPTNIQMLSFQLEQVPESNKIFSQIKEKNAVVVQKKFTIAAGNIETWPNASDSCQLGHPLDASGVRTVYQIQDAWGTPLRFWTSEILTWSDPANQNWNASIRNLLSSRLQQANWGFIIESAGKDGKFGWWGQSGTDAAVKSNLAADNVYSVGE
jgi:hypothetical protein